MTTILDSISNDRNQEPGSPLPPPDEDEQQQQQQEGDFFQQDEREPIAWVPDSPDGGWGWVVVFAAFLIHVFADGIVYSFGIMIVEFLDTFNEGRGLTSWIVSLLTGLTLGAGPVASAVTNRFGCRATTIIGAVIASFGCAISFFATSIVYLMISVGIIMGFGFSLMYCPSIIMVTMYFDDRRALATGIAVCGAGIGTFIFAPFTTYLIEQYSWRGAFLIDAGIVLNCAVCGALFRPLKSKPVYQDNIELEELSNKSSLTQPTSQTGLNECLSPNDALVSAERIPRNPDHDSDPPLSPTEIEMPQQLKNGVLLPKLSLPNGTTIVAAAALDSPNLSMAYSDFVTSSNNHNKDTNEDSGLLNYGTKMMKAGSVIEMAAGKNDHHHVHPSSLITNNKNNNKPSQRTHRVSGGSSHHSNRNRGMSESSGGGFLLSIPDVFYQGSLRDISRDYESNRDIYRSLAILDSQQISQEEQQRNGKDAHDLHKGKTRSGSGKINQLLNQTRISSPDRDAELAAEMQLMERSTEESEVKVRWCEELRTTLRQMAGLSLMKDPLFLLFTVSNFLTSIGFNAPLIFLPDKAHFQLNISKEGAAWTLSAFGISNTVGRVFVGWVSDKQLPFRWGRDIRANRLWIYNVSLTFCGVITSFSFLSTDLTSLIIYSALFGFSLSTYVCLTSVILVDLFGIDKLTNAFGLLLLFQGISSIVGPPIAGWIVDSTSNYDLSFVFAGINLAISGLMLFVVPCLERRVRSESFINRKSATENA